MKVVEGVPRAVFLCEEARSAELLSRLLAPDPYYITIFLWEIIRVETGRAEGWTYDDSKLRITCTPESLVVEESGQEIKKQHGSARAKLTIREAKRLLSKWRFEHVRWEFRHTRREARKSLKMKANISQDEGRIERPVLFRVSDPWGRHLGLARDLIGAVRIAAGSRRRSERHSSFSISAIYADGSESVLLPEQYSRRKEATVDGAVRYIRTRDEGIRAAKEMGIRELQIEMLLGEQVDRCSPDDPEEKQIEDYIKNAPDIWLTDEELRSEEASIFRIINSGKQKQKACFVFST